MTASEEDQVVQAPPQPPSPIPDEPFFAPTVVDGIDGEDTGNYNSSRAKETVTDLFSSLSARMTEAVRVSRTAVGSVVPRLGSKGATLPSALFFGDSITAAAPAVANEHGPGWAARLQSDYAGLADVFTRGYSGYNTRWALHMLPHILHGLPATAELKVVTIFFGANDAVAEGGAQNVPLGEYAVNLKKLASFVLAFRKTDPIVPILITPPPIQEKCNNERDATRFIARTKAYANACVTAAKQLGCPVVDLHTAMTDQLKQDGAAAEEMQNALDKYLYDGLHLNTEGNKFVAEMVLATLKKDVQSLHPDSLRPLFPGYKDIDPSNPEEALGTSALV